MKRRSLLSCLILSLFFTSGLMACGEDDPEATPVNNSSVNNNNNSSVNNNNNSSVNNNNNPNNSTNNNNNSNNNIVDLKGDCEKACADLIGCSQLADICSEEIVQNLLSQCILSCTDDEDAQDVIMVEGLGCEASIPFLSEALDLEEICEDAMVCMPEDDDFLSDGVEDTWDACISDNGVWNRYNESISSAGRVAGYEQIADLIWRQTPTATLFLDAREVYATDEGLDSRIQRREDEHYPPVMDNNGDILRCRDEGVPAMDPDRCVGPGLILPVLNEAFRAGAQGEDMLANAARVKAALLWFMLISTYKEATTCTVKAKDCDSSYAYYTGDMPRDQGIGLAGAFRTTTPDSHERVWDGLLAVRCWRDLDSEEEATDLALRDRALGQLDRALNHGAARLILDRLLGMDGHTGDERAADWAFLQVLGPVLNREALVRNETKAQVLIAEWGKTADTVDVGAVTAALLEIFPCP